jgi:hypothetical protein
MTNLHPQPPTAKQKIAFDVLVGEREYQNMTHGGGPTPTMVNFANLLIEYTDKLAVDATVDPTGASPAGGPLKRLREIAAIALHAMEIYGIQPRENHVPASAGITGTVNIVGNADKTAPPRVATPTPAASSAVPAAADRTAPAPTPHTAPIHLAPSGAAVEVRHAAAPVEHHPVTEEHGQPR